MKQLKLTLLFLAINFSGLALGNWLMNNGPSTDWYVNLNKAPWTPPGWVFAATWTLIMICFSVYLGKLFLVERNTQNIQIFSFHFILNVSWNFWFFNQYLIGFSLFTIILLTLLLFVYYYRLSKKIRNYKYLLLPYIIWLCLATSLNVYILAYN